MLICYVVAVLPPLLLMLLSVCRGDRHHHRPSPYIDTPGAMLFFHIRYIDAAAAMLMLSLILCHAAAAASRYCRCHAAIADEATLPGHNMFSSPRTNEIRYRHGYVTTSVR